MLNNTTDVRPHDLNYNSYVRTIYDDDIVRSIPGHSELHHAIGKYLKENGLEIYVNKILELGVGTGLTTKYLLDIIPKAKFLVIDFSEQMISGAKQRLKDFSVEYKIEDYSHTNFENSYYDIVVSVIGLHHQTAEGKIKLFKKMYDCLGENGSFIFGDLMTYEDKRKAALQDALHYHHLVEYARNEESLKEWSYHHKFLNNLTSVEKQVKWLKNVGFTKVKLIFERMNTILLVAEK